MSLTDWIGDMFGPASQPPLNQSALMQQFGDITPNPYLGLSNHVMNLLSPNNHHLSDDEWVIVQKIRKFKEAKEERAWASWMAW